MSVSSLWDELYVLFQSTFFLNFLISVILCSWFWSLLLFPTMISLFLSLSLLLQIEEIFTVLIFSSGYLITSVSSSITSVQIMSKFYLQTLFCFQAHITNWLLDISAGIIDFKLTYHRLSFSPCVYQYFFLNIPISTNAMINFPITDALIKLWCYSLF